METINSNNPITVEGLVSMTVNQVLARASKQPVPSKLFGDFWYEGEVSCLFADSNLGKSILAVDIAHTIAMRGRRVLYFDFELSDKQFQLRYSTEDGRLSTFPETLYRASLDPYSYESSYNMMDSVECMIDAVSAEVVIIDNLTWLCSASENGEEAASLMQRLMALKMHRGFSLLVIAHTPKRDTSRPITANDLAGSRKLFNFFDSVFAIGRSAREESVRYIKQLKCRNGEFTNGSDNVALATIVKKSDGMTRFEISSYGRESDHLKEISTSNRDELIREVKQLHGEGLTCRDIAELLNISIGSVSNYINK